MVRASIRTVGSECDRRPLIKGKEEATKRQEKQKCLLLHSYLPGLKVLFYLQFKTMQGFYTKKIALDSHLVDCEE